jgi:hypothetical protein
VCTSKSCCTSILRPSGNTSVSPQLGCCSGSGFLRSNSTATNFPSAGALFVVFLFHRRFFRWRSRVRSSNLDCDKTRFAASRCSQNPPLTAEPQLVSAVSAPLPAVLRSSIQLEHRTALIEQVRCSNAYIVPSVPGDFSSKRNPHRRNTRRRKKSRLDSTVRPVEGVQPVSMLRVHQWEASGWLSLGWSFRNLSREIAHGSFSGRQRFCGSQCQWRFGRFERRLRNDGEYFLGLSRNPSSCRAVPNS